MDSNYFAVIMAGGIGSRFWPVSTRRLPKQFLDLLGTGRSLLQQTFSRLSRIVPAENVLILTNSAYAGLVLEQLPEISENQILTEPAMRNTAPCILLAALKIKKRNPNALMLVAPSDHWIEDEAAFKKDIEACFETARKEDILMTLGIRPDFPNTGFGYIEVAETGSVVPVKQFREKPDYETARKFVESGNFYWNAGIFVWQAEAILNSFQKYLPEMYGLFEKGQAAWGTPDEEEFILKNYPLAENISIDFGIMEKAENVFVKKAGFDWNDLGTWGSLYDKLPKTTGDNAVVNADTMFENAAGNLVYTGSKKLVVVEDLDDFLIVDKDDVLLIYPRKKEQEIKELLQAVGKKFGDGFL